MLRKKKTKKVKGEKRNYFSCLGGDYYSFNHIGRNKYKPSNWK